MSTITHSNLFRSVVVTLFLDDVLVLKRIVYFQKTKLSTLWRVLYRSIFTSSLNERLRGRIGTFPVVLSTGPFHPFWYSLPFRLEQHVLCCRQLLSRPTLLAATARNRASVGVYLSTITSTYCFNLISACTVWIEPTTTYTLISIHVHSFQIVAVSLQFIIYLVATGRSNDWAAGQSILMPVVARSSEWIMFFAEP